METGAELCRCDGPSIADGGSAVARDSEHSLDGAPEQRRHTEANDSRSLRRFNANSPIVSLRDPAGFERYRGRAPTRGGLDSRECPAVIQP